ncbi:MAG: hypothetical protein BHV64_06445 [Alistipes sp. 56_sp_Nov_56_25]|nr:MAG: hypothetical protein BHV64_06445 [Alistipes sp. 56_sp_Nov_56_25]
MHYDKRQSLRHIFKSQVGFNNLSIPSKTILLEEGKMADRLYLIRKGCLHLIFYNEGKTSFPNFFFERDIVASFDNLYKHTPSLFLFRKYRTNGNIGNKKA